jgi:hypothetical protein
LELQVNKQMYDHHEMKIIRNGWEHEFKHSILGPNKKITAAQQHEAKPL